MKHTLCFLVVFGFCIISCCNAADKETHFTYRGTAVRSNNYILELINLSLEKTSARYGPYKIDVAPEDSFTQKRALSVMNQHPELNMIFMKAYDDMFKEFQRIKYIPFPTDLNVAGYRVCLTTPQKSAQMKDIKSIKDLSKLRVVQSKTWSDAQILSANGLKVVIAEEEQIYKFVAFNRGDILCIAINHIEKAMENGKFKEGLVLDENFALYYPMPRFLYMNADNKESIQRITQGLTEAYADGSIQALWSKFFLSNIALAQMKKRTIIQLHNPYLTALPRDYEKYVYDPKK